LHFKFKQVLKLRTNAHTYERNQILNSRSACSEIFLFIYSNSDWRHDTDSIFNLPFHCTWLLLLCVESLSVFCHDQFLLSSHTIFGFHIPHCTRVEDFMTVFRVCTPVACRRGFWDSRINSFYGLFIFFTFTCDLNTAARSPLSVPVLRSHMHFYIILRFLKPRASFLCIALYSGAAFHSGHIPP
jgi:hypothetical protein